MGLAQEALRLPFIRPKTRQEEGPKLPFPLAKTDFSQGPFGNNAFDLANAHTLQVVRIGDVLSMDVEVVPGEQMPTVRLLYMGPATNGPSKASDTQHSFLPEEPNMGLRGLFVGNEFTKWQKVGHITPDTWNAMVDNLDSR